MPQNKREGIFYGVIIALLMSSFMSTFNNVRNNGLSTDTLKHSLLLEPMVFIIVMLVETLVISKLAHTVANKLSHPNDSVQARGLVLSLCMVTGMSFMMTLIGLSLAGTPINELPVRFAGVWPMNFCVAFFLQTLVVTPIARYGLRIIRLISREPVAVAIQE